jgi:hypothetical protein
MLLWAIWGFNGFLFLILLALVLSAAKGSEEALNHEWCGGWGSPEAADAITADMGGGVHFEPGVPTCSGDVIPQTSPYTGRAWGS